MGAIPHMAVSAIANGIIDLTITITPATGRPGQYAARLNDGRLIVNASKQPFLDAARVLVAEGHSTCTMLEAWRPGAIDWDLRATLGVAAALDVRETPHGPAFRPFMAPQSLLAPPPIAPTEGDQLRGLLWCGETMSAASSFAFTCPIGAEPRREIEPDADADIVIEITAHLARELRREIPLNMRIKIFWARAKALRHEAPHEQIKQQFIALANRSGLITDLGHHGEEDVRHVLDWALRGLVPFELSKPLSRDKSNDPQNFV